MSHFLWPSPAVSFGPRPPRPLGAGIGSWAMLYTRPGGGPRARRLVQGYKDALKEAEAWMVAFVDLESIALDCFETRERLVLRRMPEGRVVFEPSWLPGQRPD